MATSTLFDKVWDTHVVKMRKSGAVLLHVDRQMLHDGTGARPFERLRAANRSVRNPELTVAVQDHLLSSHIGRTETSNPAAIEFMRAIRNLAEAAGVAFIGVEDPRQGIEHVIAPELGITLPGCTIVCNDSHTCTNGALGAIALGIGSSESEHVLATQTLIMRKPKRLRITFNGSLGRHVSAKDMVLYLIGKIGVAAGVGYAVEYAGPAIRSLEMDGRLTICNMSIEFGARVGMIAPDDTTFNYLHNKPFAPAGTQWDAALTHWRSLASDESARFDREVSIDASAIEPQVTWGNSPQDTIGVCDRIPDPAHETDAARRDGMRKALAYMALTPGMPISGLPIDKVFIGSCTNSRLSDLRAAAAVAKGRKVATGVVALVVPGSTAIKRVAEAEGLDKIFNDAGFEWRESACSMCAAVNDDRLQFGERCVATSNRNFEGRQGEGSRTHLASPATAAAAAITGRITDVRKLGS